MPTPTSPEAVFGQRADTPQVEIFGGVYRRTIVWGKNAMVCEITLPKGVEVPRHNHVHEQCGYVVSGRLQFTVGDETRLLGPGDGWAIPSDTPHSVRAVEDTIAIDVFSPVREEYK